MVRQRRLSEPTNLIEVLAIGLDELLGPRSHRTGSKDTLLLEVVRERPNQGSEIDVVLRIPRCQPEELIP